MLTDKDIQKLITALEGRLATKDDLNREILQLKQELIQFKHESSEKSKKIEEDIAKFKDESFGRFKDIQEDILILACHQDVWEDHEKRINTIEGHIFSN